MKIIPPLLATLLSAVSSPSAALNSGEASSSFITNELSGVLGSSDDPNDWQQQISCTIDTSNNGQTVVDEEACKSRNDANSNPCVWCSLPQNPFIQGACLSQPQKEAAGQFCSNSDTHAPASTPAIEPAQETNCVSITDETTCTAAIDATANPNQNCVFCNFPVVGGKCVTSTLAESFARFCTQEDGEGGEDSTFLRGRSNIAGGWKTMDSSCLSDNTNNSEDCGSKTDSNGDSCMWCDAAGVFGECVSRSQKVFFGDYLECAEDDVIAVE